MKGYFAIGIENTKTEMNIGTLWRSAFIFGAAYIFTIGKRYKKQSSDTPNTWKKIPLFHYKSYAEFFQSIPYDCMLIGIEMDDESVPIKSFYHPDRCIYLLGAEDHGLSGMALDSCHKIIQLPGEFSLNVATAGSIIMYDRYIKRVKE